MLNNENTAILFVVHALSELFQSALRLSTFRFEICGIYKKNPLKYIASVGLEKCVLWN